MDSHEYFKMIANKVKRFRYITIMVRELNAELGYSGPSLAKHGSDYKPSEIVSKVQELEQERNEIIQLKNATSKILALLPSVDQAQIIQRRYLYGQSMRQAANEVGLSIRAAYYAQSEAFNWLDANCDMDDLATRTTAGHP